MPRRPATITAASCSAATFHRAPDAGDGVGGGDDRLGIEARAGGRLDALGCCAEGRHGRPETVRGNGAGATWVARGEGGARRPTTGAASCRPPWSGGRHRPARAGPDR